METKYVAYYRVSTARQGASGLGLEAQREAVARFLSGSGQKLLAEFTEMETGKGADALDKRPQLREAIATAKRQRAVILIAKLDRLARNVHFVSGLQEAKVKFTAADMPEANELTIHLMAAMSNAASRLRPVAPAGFGGAHTKSRGCAISSSNLGLTLLT